MQAVDQRGRERASVRPYQAKGRHKEVILGLMSRTAIQHLLVEACEPQLNPATNRFELFAQGCRAAGLRAYPVKAIVPAFTGADGHYATLPKPLVSWEDEIGFWSGYFGSVLSALGQPATPHQLRELVKYVIGQQRVEISPELPALMQQIRRQGGRVVLVADWYASFRQTLINSGLLGLFPEVFLAGQQGVYLEEQDGILTMLRVLGLQPAEVAFLGTPRVALAEVGVTTFAAMPAAELALVR